MLDLPWRFESQLAYVDKPSSRRAADTPPRSNQITIIFATEGKSGSELLTV